VNGSAPVGGDAVDDLLAGVRVEVHPLTTRDLTVLDGYRLHGRIGEGGQGSVYLGTDDARGLVAVKVLHANWVADPASRDRLAGEVAAARRVPALCTARLLDARLDGPTPYLVTEFVDGPSLQRQVRSNGPLAGDALDRLAVGTLTALITIHRAGLVHHDVKPGNVLLGPDGPRVVDFGIAAPTGTVSPGASSTDGVLATPAFMAPEQLDPAEVTPAADLFSWASTMTFAATGRSPFHAGDEAALLHRLEHEAPDLAGVPQHLRSLLRSCLIKDPQLRPSAQQALNRLLEDLQPAGPPATPVWGTPDSGATAPAPPPAAAGAPDRRPQAVRHRPPTAGRRGGRRRRHSSKRLLAVVAVVVAVRLASGADAGSTEQPRPAAPAAHQNAPAAP